MRPTALLALILLAAAPSSASAADDGLTALVLQAGDHTTATQALTNAGFTVKPLPFDATPAGADLVFIPTGAYSDKAWARFATERGPRLATFVETGGVVVEMHQPSGTHSLPSWLPDELSAPRSAGSQNVLRVTGGEHRLVADLPRHAHEPTRLACETHAATPVAWGLFPTWKGFRVLLSGGTAAGDAALLEAARGKGRIVMSALLLDRPSAEGEDAATRTAFFAALHDYVDEVKKGAAPDVVPTPCLGAGVPGTGDPAPCAWDLGLSDVAVYERRDLARKEGQLVPSGAPSVVTVSGYTLTDRRQYMPVSVARADLPAIFTFRLPPSDESDADVEIALALPDITPFVAKGAVSSRTVLDAPPGEPQVWVSGRWTFDTTGKSAKSDTHRIEDGTASTQALVDVARGVVLRARVEFAYRFVKLDAKRGEKPAEVSQAFEHRLRRVRVAREPDVQREIDIGIDRGVAWLRENPQEPEKDGKPPNAPWKPHGGYAIGTTSLAILTLVACDVPGDDPVVRDALDWLFTKDPSKTYDRSVALMAIDEAYAPAGEKARLIAGAEPTQRKLPDDRQAWVLREAEELEKTSHSPGS